jgi:heme exporter protein CcmB
MIRMLRLVLVVAAKDLRLEFRSRTALLSSVTFAALVLVVFNFSRDPTATAMVDLAPSVLWVTIAFAAVITLNRSFNVEREHDALSGLRLAPVPREALYLGKVLANLVFVGIVEAITVPLFVLFFNVDLGQALAGIVSVIALATVGFVAPSLPVLHFLASPAKLFLHRKIRPQGPPAAPPAPVLRPASYHAHVRHTRIRRAPAALPS